MTESAWLRGAALYQLYPLSFRSGGGQGWGDLPGAIAGLDHVAALGVDGVWLCPVYPSPWADFGYDVADHRAVDPRMGTLADFDRFLAAAHARGLKVLVDLVCGHTSDRHPWFDASRRSRSGPYADFYVWADAAPDGTPPNNWLSVFGGAAWTWEPRRRQYYLHHFLSSQPALNLLDDACFQAVLDNARFWLNRGVDGFRIDAVDFFAHDPALRPNPAAPPADEPPLKPFGRQIHVHDMLHPSIRPLLERLRAEVDRFPGRVLLGELSSQPGAAARIAAYTAPGGLDAAYTLSLAKGAFTAEAFAAALTGVDDPGAIAWSFSNHDVERAVSRWCPPGADPAAFNRLLAALFCALPGTLCLYQGEELALPQAVLGREHLRDPFGITYWPEFPGRDGSRTPIPWVAGAANAGFCAAGAEPWLPLDPAHGPLAVDRQAADPGSPLAVWRAALARRNTTPALRHGALRGVEAAGAVLAFERVTEGTGVRVCFNLSNAPARYQGRTLAPLEAVVA
ncbi:alpha-glucosidase [Azospirillum fermentarium]|uniref:alpha-amylase family glycosyl hydrolase n=1 Tax=Azospirillum fermentarium TaxID=1233114 RepID=UPI0022265018|nr:alpha-amylase family glycosyl hydrolase [Azospirillum fermentarium]MCW2246064.1 alpha-glucosidase [Azospirillum fermentarium]